METATILSHVDHTLLKPEATWDQIKTLCDEAMGLAAPRCVSAPSYVKHGGMSRKFEDLHRHRFPQWIQHYGGQNF